METLTTTVIDDTEDLDGENDGCLECGRWIDFGSLCDACDTPPKRVATSALQNRLEEFATFHGLKYRLDYSTVSRYVYLYEWAVDEDGDPAPEARDFRISDHDLPSQYDAPDFHIELQYMSEDAAWELILKVIRNRDWASENGKTQIKGQDL